MTEATFAEPTYGTTIIRHTNPDTTWIDITPLGATRLILLERWRGWNVELWADWKWTTTFARGHWTAKVTTRNEAVIRRLKRQAPDPLPDVRELSEAIHRDRIVMQLISRDGDQCYLCLTRRPPASYEIDHIIPRAHGGDDRLSNYALACKPCNIRKSDRIISLRITHRIPCYSISRGR